MAQLNKQNNRGGVPVHKVWLIVIFCIILTAVIAVIGGYQAGTNGITANMPIINTDSKSSQSSVISNAIKDGKYICQGSEKSGDINQMLCVLPLEPNEPFQFKNHLKCKQLLEERMSNSTFGDPNDLTWLVEVDNRKIDNINFTLDFINNTFNTIQLTYEGNPNIPIETYTIIEESNDIIQATSTVAFNTETAKDFITLSKDVGIGTLVRHDLFNKDLQNKINGVPPSASIRAIPFHCEEN